MSFLEDELRQMAEAHGCDYLGLTGDMDVGAAFRRNRDGLYVVCGSLEWTIGTVKMKRSHAEKFPHYAVATVATEVIGELGSRLMEYDTLPAWMRERGIDLGAKYDGSVVRTILTAPNEEEFVLEDGRRFKQADVR